LQPYEGNVFATNPTSGIFGPICDDFWSMKDVIIKIDLSVFIENIARNTQLEK
jgi:hypothetical protein